MTTPVYEAWKPIEGLPRVLYVEALHDDYEGLRVLLRPNDSSSRMLRIVFESVVGYMNVNEGYRQRTWGSIPSMETLPTMLTVRDSKWVEWLMEDAGGVLSKDELIHFAIYTPEDCIDVVTAFPPQVHWLGA